VRLNLTSEAAITIGCVIAAWLFCDDDGEGMAAMQESVNEWAPTIKLLDRQALQELSDRLKNARVV
jgi:hypothetical protein